jgi:hypothetical protein
MGETGYCSILLLVVDERPPIQGESINKSKKAGFANAYPGTKMLQIFPRTR